jgi:hypothetical protein
MKNTCSLFVYIHRKLGNAFVWPYLSPHEYSCWAHANFEHGHPGQVCGMLPIPEDNLSSMIYLLFNGISGPKWM